MIVQINGKPEFHVFGELRICGGTRREDGPMGDLPPLPSIEFDFEDCCFWQWPGIQIEIK